MNNPKIIVQELVEHYLSCRPLTDDDEAFARAVFERGGCERRGSSFPAEDLLAPASPDVRVSSPSSSNV